MSPSIPSYGADELLKLAEELRLAIARKDAGTTVNKIQELHLSWEDHFGYAGRIDAIKALKEKWR
jgi:hypothetical protein